MPPPGLNSWPAVLSLYPRASSSSLITLSPTHSLRSSKALPSSVPPALCTEPPACRTSLLVFHLSLKLRIDEPKPSVSPLETCFFVCFLSVNGMSLCAVPRGRARNLRNASFCLASALPSPVDFPSPGSLRSVLFFPFLSPSCRLSPEPPECFSFCPSVASSCGYPLLDVRGCFFK